MNSQYRIGIDVGGTNTVVGLIDGTNTVVSHLSRATEDGDNGRVLMAVISEMIDDLLNEKGLSNHDLVAIGAGFPGKVNTRDGIVERLTNLDIVDLPFAAILQQTYNVPVTLVNDADAAAYGEYLLSGKKWQSFVMITLGTGVGSGIVYNGEPFRGVENRSPELGHMVIDMKGRLCKCGKRGCLERYASATALIEAYETKFNYLDSVTEKKAKCSKDSQVDAKMIFDAYHSGEAEAVAVVDDYIEHLAAGIVNVYNLYFPDCICLGGGIARQGQVLIDLLQDALAVKSVIGNEKAVNIVTASSVDAAALVGAANY